MKVLVVSSYPPRRCGIGAYAANAVRTAAADGDDVTVLSPPDGDGDVRTPFRGGGAFRRAAKVGERFDRIVVHFQPALYYRPRAPLSKVATSLSLLWLVLRHRRPARLEILVHEVDRAVRWRPDHALLGLAFRLAPALEFHTRAEWRRLERDYGIRVRGRLVRHSVAPPGERLVRVEARSRLGIGGAPEPVFVCIGFFQPSKGYDRAVEAFARAGSPGSLYLVGSVREDTAENRAYLARLRAACAATTGAHLIEGFVPDESFDLWVSAADRVVLPYRRSWSSGVLAKAQAAGTPAIVAATGGLPEQAGYEDVVVNGDDGLVEAIRASGPRGGEPATRAEAGR